uniref:Uncharacterized protein n=1 Tax=Manihot esculenta TaxID=3983 RepID=A0A2C9U1Y3_MANES
MTIFLYRRLYSSDDIFYIGDCAVQIDKVVEATQELLTRQFNLQADIPAKKT